MVRLGSQFQWWLRCKLQGHIGQDWSQLHHGGTDQGWDLQIESCSREKKRERLLRLPSSLKELSSRLNTCLNWPWSQIAKPPGRRQLTSVSSMHWSLLCGGWIAPSPHRPALVQQFPSELIEASIAQHVVCGPVPLWEAWKGDPKSRGLLYFVCNINYRLHVCNYSIVQIW